MPCPMIGMSHKPVALTIGSKPSPAVVYVPRIPTGLLFEAAAVICFIIVAWIYLAANRTLDFKGHFRINNPRICAALFMHCQSMHGAACCPQIERPGHI